MTMNPVAPDGAELLQRMSARLCASQWRGFLQALSQEFTAALPAQDLRELLQRVGTRFAHAHTLPQVQTLPQLQHAMNTLWHAIDWGSVVIEQQPDRLSIRHELSPIDAAFGADSRSWAVGFLEGVYQEWFSQSGAAGMRVSHDASHAAAASIRLQLHR